MPTHNEIEKRAQELWERRGRPEGYDAEFWVQARRELRLRANSSGRTANLAGGSGSGSDGPPESGVRRARDLAESEDDAAPAARSDRACARGIL